MPSLFLARSRSSFFLRLLFACFLTISSAPSLLADSSGPLRTVPPGGCYCGCSKRTSMGACTKLCETPKYASRWWATTCAKPRIRPRSANPGAGPRFPHPGRAERASASR